MLSSVLFICLINFIILTGAQFQFQADPNPGFTIDKTNLYHINPLAEDYPTETRIVELESPFSFQSQQIKIVIHGWLANRNHLTVDPLRSGFLATGHDALFMADWSEASRTFSFNRRYFVRPIGLRFAKLIENFVSKNNIDLSRIHILGHGLGSHIAGIIGDYFNGTIGRITGLDPSGALFDDFVVDGLLPKHAKFVDCIHTATPNIGQSFQRGHIDFYPNYGKFEQLGCDGFDLLVGTLCNIQRASFFYGESIQLPRTFVAFPCSLKNIYRRQCSSKKAKSFEYMGEMVSNRARGTYFLRTNRASPYGLGLYSVVHLKLIRNNNTITTDLSSNSTSLADSNNGISKRTTRISDDPQTQFVASSSESPLTSAEKTTDAKVLPESQTETEPNSPGETESETSKPNDSPSENSNNEDF